MKDEEHGHRELCTSTEFILQTTDSKNFKDGTILPGNLIKIQHVTVT